MIFRRRCDGADGSIHICGTPEFFPAELRKQGPGGFRRTVFEPHFRMYMPTVLPNPPRNMIFLR